MTSLDYKIETTIQVLENLSESEKQLLIEELFRLGQIYNIPGISNTQLNQTIENEIGLVTISPIGGNITNLEFGDEQVLFSGQIPYTIPYLNEQKQFELNSPYFYRWIYHNVTPVANKYSGFNQEVHNRLEQITSLSLTPNYNTGHHGISQCMIGELIRDNNIITYKIIHEPDQANLFTYEKIMQVGFDGEWFREDITIYNPNVFPIPISLLRHPYFSIPTKSFEKAKLSIISNSSKKRKSLFNLKDYSSLGEQRFSMLNEGESLEFDRGDGIILETRFMGDYDLNIAGIQIFSNGFSEIKILEDYTEKFVIHKKRLEAMVKSLDKLGIDTSWYSKQALNEEFILHQQMLKNLRSVCIEDNTSYGNIYSDPNSKPVILQPRQSVTYTRMTRRVA